MSLQRVPLSDPEWDRVYEWMAKSFPEACVLSIDRVVNPLLHARFEGYVLSHPNDVQTWAYHGTRKWDNIHSIVEKGFLSELNVTSAYGKGTYFSTQITYSREYCMIEEGRSWVLIANVSAPKDYKKPAGHMFVRPDNASCIPIYVVEFTRK